MFNIKLNSILGVVILLWCIFPFRINNNLRMTNELSHIMESHYWNKDHHDTIKVPRDIYMRDYFQFMDSLVCRYDSLTSYPLSEHLLVRANPWVIDVLTQTDYYTRMAQDSFVYDQKQMIILPSETHLIVPDLKKAQELYKVFSNTTIDVNIPEYKLRIKNQSSNYYEFLVRVGRHEEKYLEMSGRLEDLRTKTGEGTIIGYNRFPRYVNPANNAEYYVTRRDDGRVTKLPQIPFIETELNGKRYGQLIHPTTNPETLGNAYSNGCIGTSEADAWVIYYYAPIGTTITIRYDLNVVNAKGDTIQLEDIYNYKQQY